jgi:hypothetical protein
VLEHLVFSKIALLEVGTFFARGTTHQIQYFPVRLFSNIVYPFFYLLEDLSQNNYLQNNCQKRADGADYFHLGFKAD